MIDSSALRRGSIACRFAFIFVVGYAADRPAFSQRF
jgi:hypothetical protein